MTLLQLQCFITVAEQGSFTKASVLMHLSQSAVSQHINSLEAELGFTLLQRSSKSVVLTNEGNAFLKECQVGLVHLENAVTLAKRVHEGFDGYLRVGCASPLNTEPLFTKSLGLFRLEYPNVELTIEQNDIDILLPKVKADELDVIFTLSFNVFKQEHIATKTLRKGNRILLTSSKHPLASLDVFDIQDYFQEHFIAVHPKSGGSAGFRIFTEHYKISPKATLVPNIDTLLLYVKLGLGVAIVDDNLKNISDPAFSYNRIKSEWDDSLNYLVAAWNEKNNNPSLQMYLDVIDGLLLGN